jgi:hypothetical protein
MADSLIGNCGVKVVIGVDEAPIDGKQYAREDAAWTEVVSGGSAEEVGAFLGHTGWISGGVISVNADTAKIDVTAGTGYVVNHADPVNPFRTLVEWDEQLAVTIPNLATTTSSGVGIPLSGTVAIKDDRNYSVEDYRTTIILGFLGHQDNATITTANSKVGATAYDSGLIGIDFATHVIGPSNASGNVYSVNSGGTLTKTAGRTFDIGINAQVNPENPHFSTDATSSPSPFLRALRSSSDPNETITIPNSIVTTLDPNGIDLGGGTVGVVGNNRWTIQVVYWVPGAGISLVAYGQDEFLSLAAAQTAFNSGAVSFEERVQLGATPQRAYIFLKQGISGAQFVDTANLIIRPAPKFRIGGIGL